MSEMSLPVMETDVLAVLREAMEKSGSPLSVSDLAKTVTKDQLGLPKKARKADVESALQQKLDEMVSTGRLYRLQPTAKQGKPAYFTETAEDLARSAFRKAVEDRGPISAADAKKAPVLKVAKKYLNATRQNQILAGLVKEGVIYEWPKQGKTVTKILYSTKPADPSKYLDSALEKFRKELKALAGKLQSAGVGFDDLIRASRQALGPADTTRAVPTPPPEAPGEEDLCARILDMMDEVLPAARTGAAVSMANLWHAMESDGVDKPAFDRGVVRLAERALVGLHRYDYPAGLSQEQRDELVSDGRGGFYVAIARRV